MIDPWHRVDLNERFRFFLKHASHGVAWAPGAHAMDLARAEQAAEQGPWRYTWEADKDADVSWLTGPEMQDYESGWLQVEAVSIWHTGEMHPRRTIRGVVRYGFDADVQRVCEAELALQMGVEGDDEVGYSLRQASWDCGDAATNEPEAKRKVG